MNLDFEKLAFSVPDKLDDLETPCVLISLERVESNLRAMIDAVGGANRLRPHIKTHKMQEVVRLKLQLGIERFKAATIAEVEMAIRAGARDVLLAMQPVGVDVKRLATLIERFPDCQLSTIVDDLDAAKELAKVAADRGVEIPIYVDVDVGMHRTGIHCDLVAPMYRDLAGLPGIVPVGLHAYDGHLRSAPPIEMDAAVDRTFQPVWRLLDDLESEHRVRPRIVGGGTASSISLARQPEIEVSAGTTVFWDGMQEERWPDSPFQCAVMLAGRVISRPTEDELCVNIGHKAVASEMPHPRVHWADLDDAEETGHSEEHVTVRTRHRDLMPVGSILLGVPRHVCPTIALHETVNVVSSGAIVDQWRVIGRSRHLSV